jgi:hypothetical protein
VFPDATPGGPVTAYQHQILALDGLGFILKSLVNGVVENDKYHTQKARDLLERKRRKKVLLEGAERFNQNPKEGIAFLQSGCYLNFEFCE